MSSFSFLAVIISSLNEFVYCWRFDAVGLNENEIELSRIAIYGFRAFISIPRVYDEQPITLVEVPWPEHSIFSKSSTVKPFPDADSQKLGECSKLQSAVTLDTDNRGRLYVLDKGIENICGPKILVYDLKFNTELLQKDLENVPVDNLTALVIDVNPLNGDIRIILGDAGENTLLVYNVKEHIWWKLALLKNFPFDHNNFHNIDNSFNLNQLSISKRTSTLYATSSESSHLYSINLNEFRHLEEPLKLYCNSYDYNETVIPIQYVGTKFGKSSDIYAGFRNNLYYIYKRDHVVLKWNTNTPFTTENTEIVIQNSSLIPNAVQIFAEPYFFLWVLNSKRNKNSSYTVKLK